MKKLMSLWVGVILLTSVQMVWADDMGKMDGMSTPAAASTPVVKHKSVKKTAKKNPRPRRSKKFGPVPWGTTTVPKPRTASAPNAGWIWKKSGKSRKALTRLALWTWPGSHYSLSGFYFFNRGLFEIF